MRSSDLTHQRRAEIIYAEFTAAQSQLQSNTINRINYQGGESSARLVVDVAEGAVFTSTDTNLFTVPTAPTGVNLVMFDVSGVGVGNTLYTLSWNAPTSVGGTPITYYTITSNYGIVIQSTTTSAEIAVPYHTNNTFTVTATNIKGTSLSSSTTPSAPTGVTAVAASLSAVISWTPPVSNGGALLTGYSMVSTPFGSQTTLPTNTTATFTDLTVRPYTFAVFATSSAAKNSALSAQSAAVTPLSCLIGSTQVTLNDGMRVRMDELQLGDVLMSYDPMLEEFTDAIVTLLQGVMSAVQSINDGLLVATASHVHYVKRADEWIATPTIQVGDFLLDSDSNEVEIVSIVPQEEPELVYVLEVTGNHLYYANGILTHNGK